MMFTHEQLLKAVRKAGRHGQQFTCASVRESLGLSTRDKKQLNRFYAEFRALQKSAPEVFEKLGKNAYRLTAVPSEAAISELPEPLAEALPLEPEHDAQAMVCVEIEIEPEPRADAEPLAAREPTELGFAESAPELESLEMPLQLIEVDFDVDQLQADSVSETQRVEDLIRKDAPQPSERSGWFGRGQRLGRRVAEFFGLS
jgi:hypothetical protein